MGLLANNRTYIQNLNPQSLGAKTSVKIWIFSLIRKMWNVAWDFWNFRNHTLCATEGPRKLEIIYLINKRVTYHLKNNLLATQYDATSCFTIPSTLCSPILSVNAYPRCQPPPAQDDAYALTPPEEDFLIQTNPP